MLQEQRGGFTEVCGSLEWRDMERITTTYVCDICKGEHTKKEYIKQITVPVRSYDCEGRNSYERYQEVDMCNSCQKKYREVVEKHFAYVTSILGNIEAEVKF